MPRPLAGGTRLLAARLAGIDEVPCRVFAAVSDDEIARLEALDNENDEYHAPVPVVDVWAEYARLAAFENWTQDRIGEAKGVSHQLVGYRLRMNRSAVLVRVMSDNSLDEGHCIEILGVCQTSDILVPWLTTDQAQSELVAEVTGAHRGYSAGIKPTVRVVREAAKRWRELIAAAASVAESLEDPTEFVLALARDRARSVEKPVDILPFCYLESLVRSSRHVLQVLHRAGWVTVRVKGSHHHLEHPSRPGMVVTVPHPKKDLPRGLLRAIELETGAKLV